VIVSHISPTILEVIVGKYFPKGEQVDSVRHGGTIVDVAAWGKNEDVCYSYDHGALRLFLSDSLYLFVVALFCEVKFLFSCAVFG